MENAFLWFWFLAWLLGIAVNIHPCYLVSSAMWALVRVWVMVSDWQTFIFLQKVVDVQIEWWRCFILLDLIQKVHALRQKETYTHASSYRSDCHSWGSSEADGDLRHGEAGRGGPWEASPWRSSRRLMVHLTGQPAEDSGWRLRVGDMLGWSCGGWMGWWHSLGQTPSSTCGDPQWRETAWNISLV